MTYAKVGLTASYLPEKVLTNKDWETILGTSKETGTTSEWIESHTGILERRVTQENETHDYLLGNLVKQLSEKSAVLKSTPIILATNSLPGNSVPCHAARIQKSERLKKSAGYEANLLAVDVAGDSFAMAAALGLMNNQYFPCAVFGSKPNQAENPRSLISWCEQESLAQKLSVANNLNSEESFDVIAGCAGFNIALALGNTYVQSKERPIICAGIERTHQFINRQDRNSAVLFGEAAGAVLLVPSQEEGIIANHFCTDGSQCDVITLSPKFQQNGPLVHKWASRTLADLARQALEFVPRDAHTVIVPHQANPRMIRTFTENVQNYRENVDVILTGDFVGNCGAAAVAHAFDYALKNGRITSGDYVVLISFGAGLTYGYNVLKH